MRKRVTMQVRAGGSKVIEPEKPEKEKKVTESNSKRGNENVSKS